MIWTVGIVVVLIWAVRKVRPARLGDDVLKFELFRFMHFRNAREANEHMTYEDLERRLWWKVTLVTVTAFASLLLIAKDLGGTWSGSAAISCVIVSVLSWLFERRSRTYRQITLPLFATLCRMPQSRWDMSKQPWKWVRTDLKAGRVWIRLPKDWHPTKPSLKMIQDLISARLVGHWVMTSDTGNFLLTFKREKDAEHIPVSGNGDGLSESDFTFEFETEEKEVDDGQPW